MASQPASQSCPNPELDNTFNQGFWKHGRFYGNWKRDKYHFPIDKEELNRYDILNHFFLLIRDMEAYTYEITRTKPRVLDLGTGTGIWAIEIAEKYLPNAEIMAVDINRIQPPLIPRNVYPVQFDIEEPSWTPLFQDCDLIHMRLLLGSISNSIWPEIYQNAYWHSTPGLGRIEQVEIDWMPRWDGSDAPQNSALLAWAEMFLSGMDLFHRSARVSTAHVQQMLEAAGFVDFAEQTFRCYVNPWSPDQKSNLVAHWFNLGLVGGLEAMSLVPMIEKLGMTMEQVKNLQEAVKAECCQLQYHAYCVMHIWTARRP